MKVTKLCVAAASAVLLASCGGKSNEEKLREALSEYESEEAAEGIESATVTVDNSDIVFGGELGGCVELVPGEYTLDGSGSSIKLNVKTVVKEENSDEISSSSSVNILDADRNQIAKMIIYGGQTALGDAMNEGEIDAEFELTFSCYADDKADVMSKAKYIEAGELLAKAAPKADVNVDGSGLSKTLSEYGVTYECKHSPSDNDEYLKNFDLKKAMKDKDQIITAWEIYNEELLRYQFAPGDGGMDNPEAFKRSEDFRKVLHPGSGYEDDDPIGYMQNREYSYKNSDDFTSSQKQRIESFLNKYNSAFNAWRSAKSK